MVISRFEKEAKTLVGSMYFLEPWQDNTKWT